MRRYSSNQILMLAALETLPTFQLAAAAAAAAPAFSHGYKTFRALRDLCVSFNHCIFHLLELWAQRTRGGGGGGCRCTSTSDSCKSLTLLKVCVWLLRTRLRKQQTPPHPLNWAPNANDSPAQRVCIDLDGKITKAPSCFYWRQFSNQRQKCY